MNKLYLVFSSTQNRMGRMIRGITKFEYNHVSVSVDGMKNLYSFARYYRDTPLSGGFVRESRARFLCEKHPAKVAICAIEVTDEQYAKATEFIEKFSDESRDYIYNLVSAAVSPIHIRIPISRAYTCVEFAAKLLTEVGVLSYRDARKFFNVRRLYEIFADKRVYEGEFDVGLTAAVSHENYTRKNPLRRRIGATCMSSLLLLGRFFNDTLQFFD